MDEECHPGARGCRPRMGQLRTERRIMVTLEEKLVLVYKSGLYRKLGKKNNQKSLFSTSVMLYRLINFLWDD